jgi:hypothetical protein
MIQLEKKGENTGSQPCQDLSHSCVTKLTLRQVFPTLIYTAVNVTQGNILTKQCDISLQSIQ